MIGNTDEFEGAFDDTPGPVEHEHSIVAFNIWCHGSSPLRFLCADFPLDTLTCAEPLGGRGAGGGAVARGARHVTAEKKGESQNRNRNARRPANVNPP